MTTIGRRYELLGWASAREGRWLVEDDYDCEFRMSGRPVPALLSADVAGNVIYTNTFSKSLGSALRLAYMVLPEELMERYVRELGFYSSTVSSVQQVTLARILEGGEYERHVARVRKRCRDMRDALASALRSRGDGSASASRKRMRACMPCWPSRAFAMRKSWPRGPWTWAFPVSPSCRSSATCGTQATPRLTAGPGSWCLTTLLTRRRSPGSLI